MPPHSVTPPFSRLLLPGGCRAPYPDESRNVPLQHGVDDGRPHVHPRPLRPDPGQRRDLPHEERAPEAQERAGATRMAKLINGGKFPYTPAVQSWISVKLGIPFTQVSEEQAKALAK